jgi:acyl-CoA thioester hydrolase
MSVGLITIRVRYTECDPMGVAHHTAYPVWFEMGRTELLRQNGGNYRELETEGFFLAVVALEVRYRRPARYDDLLELETRITKIGVAKVCHEYKLLRQGELLATATTTLACLDSNGRPCHLPEVISEADV